jgi:serine/threonine-protein kinase
LIDFGLAKEIQLQGSTIAKLGHENFVAYEQRTQGTKKPTVDIYSLAATLYYVVTGKYPPTSWDRKHNNAELIPPKDYCNISNNLNQAILAGMALEVQDRPQTMEEWLNLLNSGTNSQETDDLSSEKGIAYRKLRDLLVAGNWKDADYETYLVMLQAVGREKNDWIRDEELLNFPCTDLRTIDSLWVKYSNGKFGFSVQKQIYLECGGKADGKYDEEVWEEFTDRVGWRMDGEWRLQLTYTLSTYSYHGHLPSSILLRKVLFRPHFGFRGFGVVSKVREVGVRFLDISLLSHRNL